MTWPFPPKPRLDPQAVAFLEEKGVPAVKDALAKLPNNRSVPLEAQQVFFNIGTRDGPNGPEVANIFRPAVEQWLRWKNQTDAAWMRLAAIASAIAALAAIVAAIRG